MSDVNDDYFNPNRYQEEMLALGIRHRIEGWVVNATAGLGKQQIDAGPSTTTKLAEIGATSPIAGKTFLRMRAGFNQSGGVEGPNYIYRYVQADLVFEVPDFIR